MISRRALVVAGLTLPTLATPALAQGLQSVLIGPYNYTHNALSSGVGVVIKSVPGTLHSINVNNATVAGTPLISAYDGSSGSGILIAALTPTVPGSFIFDVAFLTSLTVIFATSSSPADVTVAWK